MKKVTIGVLALQGSFREHAEKVLAIGATAVYVRFAEELDHIDGLILPGGESTAIGKLLVKNKLFSVLKTAIQNGLPVWGSCAGAILLAKRGSDFSLGVADFSVQRNGFGRQVDSFVKNIPISGIAESFPAIFIRAPRFLYLGSEVEIFSSLKKEAVFLQQKNIWASSFHPELSESVAVHRAFVKKCEK